MIQNVTMIEWPQAQMLPVALTPVPTSRYGWYIFVGVVLVLAAVYFYMHRTGEKRHWSRVPLHLR
jgi:hypothetical protein